MLATWRDLDQDNRELAESGANLFYQFGVGLAFLATIRPDGGPRLHPICPVIAEGGLYAFINQSPKLKDLRRDGRYAIHAFLPEDTDDEFYVTGKAKEITDPQLRAKVLDVCRHSVAESEVLFEFHIERCVHAKYRERGEFPPTYTRWVAPDSG